MSISSANDFLAQYSSKYKFRIAGLFAFGLFDQTQSLRGVLICASSIELSTHAKPFIAVRACHTDGVVNGVEMLLGAARRTCKEMGYNSFECGIVAPIDRLNLRNFSYV